MLRHVTACLGLVTILQLVQAGQLSANAKNVMMVAKEKLTEYEDKRKAAMEILKGTQVKSDKRKARKEVKKIKKQKKIAKSNFKEAKKAFKAIKRNEKDHNFEFLYKQIHTNLNLRSDMDNVEKAKRAVIRDSALTTFEASTDAEKPWLDISTSQFAFLSDAEQGQFLLGINSTLLYEYDNDDDAQTRTVPKGRLGGIVYPAQQRQDDNAMRRETDEKERKASRQNQGAAGAPQGIPPPHFGRMVARKRDVTRRRSKRDTSSGTRPEEWDLRETGVISKVKHQMACACCWAFAAIASLEAQFALATDAPEPPVFSEQHLLNCNAKGMGCLGGHWFEGWKTIRNSEYLATEATMKYTAPTIGQCTRPVYENAWKSHLHMSKWKILKDQSATGEETMLEALYQNGPLVIQVDAYNLMNYVKGTVFGDCIGGTFKNWYGGFQLHAVLMVGYTKEALIIKNSWGKTWGDGGYGLLKRGCLMEFVNGQDTFVGYGYWASYISITNANKGANPVANVVDVEGTSAENDLVFGYGSDAEAHFVIGDFSKINYNQGGTTIKTGDHFHVELKSGLALSDFTVSLLTADEPAASCLVLRWQKDSSKCLLYRSWDSESDIESKKKRMARIKKAKKAGKKIAGNKNRKWTIEEEYDCPLDSTQGIYITIEVEASGFNVIVNDKTANEHKLPHFSHHYELGQIASFQARYESTVEAFEDVYLTRKNLLIRVRSEGNCETKYTCFDEDANCASYIKNRAWNCTEQFVLEQCELTCGSCENEEVCLTRPQNPQTITSSPPTYDSSHGSYQTTLPCRHFDYTSSAPATTPTVREYWPDTGYPCGTSPPPPPPPDIGEEEEEEGQVEGPP